MYSVHGYRRQESMAMYPSHSVRHFIPSDEEKVKYHAMLRTNDTKKYVSDSLDLNKKVYSDYCSKSSVQYSNGKHFSNTLSNNNGCIDTGVKGEDYGGNGSDDVQFDYKNEDACQHNGLFMPGQKFHNPGQVFDYDLIGSSCDVSNVDIHKRQRDTASPSLSEKAVIRCTNGSFRKGFRNGEDCLSTYSSNVNSNISYSINVKRSSQNSDNKSISSFNLDTPFSKSKDTGVTLLPPCRICGAKASGFHYGVNSCEACKGFFRRALKRPMVFSCSKNRKCDIKGNKRSTCRFCRYTRCLRLGMSKESIKTGRYSHKKRTRDTIEVQRLQKSPNLDNNDSDLDNIIKHLLATHDSVVMTTTHVPQNLIYRRQLEYHNICLLRKKFGPSINSSIDPPGMLDHNSKHEGDKDVEFSFSDRVKHSAPSRSSSQLSSDSGFVDEHESVIDGDKSVFSENEIFVNHQHFPGSKNTNQDSKVNDMDQSSTQAVNNHKWQHNPLFTMPTAPDNKFLLQNNQPGCSNQEEVMLSSDRVTQLYRDVSKGFPYERKDKQTGNQLKSNPDAVGTSADDIIEDCDNSGDNCSTVSSNNLMGGERRNPLHEICYGSLNNERNTRQSSDVQIDSSSTLSKNIVSKSLLEILTKDALVDSLTSFNTSSISKISQQKSTNEPLRGHSNNTTTSCTDSEKKSESHGNTQGDTSISEIDHKPSVKAKTDTSVLMTEWKDSSDMHVKSKDEIIHRAQKWTKGYIDFAMQIPGFSSLPIQDQAALLKHAWDEVWILSTYRSYNSDLGVAITPCGTCFHMEEMELAWGKNYTRIAFDLSEIINRHNLTPELITLIKAICIITPDRCPLLASQRVTEIYWLIVSCLLRHIDMTHPEDQLIFPRLVSILTSLRELSESVCRDQDSGRGDFILDGNSL